MGQSPLPPGAAFRAATASRSPRPLPTRPARACDFQPDVDHRAGEDVLRVLVDGHLRAAVGLGDPGRRPIDSATASIPSTVSMRTRFHDFSFEPDRGVPIAELLFAPKRRRAGLAPYPLIWWVSLRPLSMQRIGGSPMRPVRSYICLIAPARQERRTVRIAGVEITSVRISLVTSCYSG